MNEISIKLNQKYKSFESGFTTVLKGNLIVLSGINGSGKSQLINIIKGRENVINLNSSNIHTNRMEYDLIDSNIELNNEALAPDKIEFRSFKENISLPEVTKSTSQTTESSLDSAYRVFTQNNTNTTFSNSIAQVERILQDETGEVDRNISKQDFKTLLRKNNFLWRDQDQFTDFIGQLFFDHATKVALGRIEAGRTSGPAFDPNSIGIAPWTELNQLFSELNFEYRFKDNFELAPTELTEHPFLFAIDEEEVIIESDKRTLADLSDGEKSIVSLCFTSLRKIEGENKKLLVLDELDAVLNPSLIESFFVVIKKYYLDKGISVIISTHSAATISLAPDDTVYYEVFKKNSSETRVIEVSKDEYVELRKVNKKFYDQISNQAERIKNLEQLLDSEKDILIITEGKTDWKYFLGALKYFHSQDEFKEVREEYFYKFGSQKDIDESTCGTTDFEEMGEAQLNKLLSNEVLTRTLHQEMRKKVRIGIFDSDLESLKLKNRSDYNVFSFEIEPEGISTEFLFIDDDIKSEIEGKRLFIGYEFDERTKRHESENLSLGAGSQKRAGKKEIIDLDVYDESSTNQAISKEEFAQAIYNQKIDINQESWESFRHIFVKVSCFLAQSIPLNEGEQPQTRNEDSVTAKPNQE